MGDPVNVSFWFNEDEAATVDAAVAKMKGPDGRPLTRSAFLRIAALEYAKKVGNENIQSEA